MMLKKSDSRSEAKQAAKREAMKGKMQQVGGAGLGGAVRGADSADHLFFASQGIAGAQEPALRS